MKISPLFSQRPERFAFVNRFGSRFLKNRIRMMNQKTKYRWSWPVYVFLFAITGLVTTMAAVEKRNRTTQPLVLKKETPERAVAKVSSRVKPASFRAEPAAAVLAESSGKEAEIGLIALDSAKTVAEEKSDAVERKSRYVVQKGEVLYWVLTPKMSFNELIELKQTIEKASLYTFDFNTIKFDPFQLYIDAIGVTIHQEKGGSGSASDGDENDKPIQSIGGYLSTTERGSLSIGKMTGDLPAVLEQLAKDDEKAVEALFAENRMAYFIAKQRKVFSGGTTTVKGDWLRDNPGRRNEGLGVFINAENRLQLYHPENVTVIINGREMNPSEVAAMDPKQLHTVIVTDVRDEAAGPGRKKRYIQLFESQPLEESR
ncbi:hypothetical protein ACO2Q8_10965 [Larkinella sp. VNQ87]|uniref:hypothetical protein n=1 Tax=Larkinella sp. VNQ87 TaxID=3400921 RepID=UPI003C0A201E